MATKKQRLVSPPQTPPSLSPAISAVHSSPLGTGTLLSYPVTSSPFSSSPTLSSTDREPSPDYFDEFEYSQEMDEYLHRVDMEAAEAQRSERGHPSPSMNGAPVSSVPTPTPVRDRKTWVVFRGKVPGIYDDSISVAFQTQGYSDAFHKLFPSRDAAELAWNAYVRDGTYPDYGKGPWVVYLGHRPGVITKISELEACVKGFSRPIFQSCSSVAEGKIKFQLFTERVARMFVGSDPFASVAGLLPQQPEEGSSREIVPAVQSLTPAPATPKHSPSSPAHQVAGSSKTASKRSASSLSFITPQNFRVSRPGDGWYVAHNAVVPGVYYGVDTLKNAQPVPGGIYCMRDKDSADQLFLHLTLNGAIVWANVGE